MEILISPRRHTYLPQLVVVTVVVLFLGCGAKMVHIEQQLLGEADSLFKAGNYEFAKIRFDKIRTFKPQSTAARIAQYYLGYINVYYDNPFASWDAALREFKQFVTLYPDDPRVDEVHSWIKMLTAMQANEKRYLGTTDSMVALKKRTRLFNKAVKKSASDSISILTDAVRKCTHVRDSLIKKNRDLEKTILDVEKKCSEAAGQ